MQLVQNHDQVNVNEKGDNTTQFQAFHFSQYHILIIIFFKGKIS